MLGDPFIAATSSKVTIRAKWAHAELTQILRSTIVGRCPSGVRHVLAGLEDAGFRTVCWISFQALMS
jgi:hypothetical protein